MSEENDGMPLPAGTCAEECVAAAYRQILRREPEEAGLRHHLALIQSQNLTIRALVRSLLLSAEWDATFIRGRTAAAVLNAVYRCALGRLPTSAELKDGRREADRAGWPQLLERIVGGSEYGERFGEGVVPYDSQIADHPEPRRTIPHEPQHFGSLQSEIKAIAFFLPQFHRIPENDAWWGEGFTEWSNVRRARPQFHGHYQPHIPSELGYYDLGQPGALERQAQLARQFGIHGFCFYYYWFGGDVLLDLPLRRMLETGVPDFPFCICWANENWTRRWDGKDDELLIAQRHSPEDDVAFIRRIEPMLTAPNYIRVEGKPMLLVYRVSLLPDARRTLQRWREYFRDRGLGELHLVMVRSFSEVQAAEDDGFDAAVQFPPHFPARPVTSQMPEKHPEFTGSIYDYDDLREQALAEFQAHSRAAKLYPGVMPSWDNTARRGAAASIWINASSESYRDWLAEVVTLLRSTREQKNQFVFINAWNEWAEGCHLEPDEQFGFAWLNATATALASREGASPNAPEPAARPEAPAQAALTIEPIPPAPKIAVSVLLYHREDLLLGFLRCLLPQISLARRKLSCELFLSFNYAPERSSIEAVQAVIAELLPGAEACVHLVEHGFNLGFGAGHNAIFARCASDIFVILNSDLRVAEDDWLPRIAARMAASDVAILGFAGNASCLREDGLATPAGGPDEAFDYIDGSALAVRSGLARQFGLFSHAFAFFYFEDADLCLRYRQIGLRLETLQIQCTHERGGSARLLPRYAMEKVLDHNRGRFLARWGNYLRTRSLPNRLGLSFRTWDRRLQCASLPAVLALLSEHPTAVLDLWGVHAQLTPLFEHPRIRLIPAWQRLHDDDYLMSYEWADQNCGDRSTALQIAQHLQTDPDFEGARKHLEQLVRHAEPVSSSSNQRALVYVARPEPLFDGKHPDSSSFVAAGETLRGKGFAVRYYSEYGAMELPAPDSTASNDWKYVAWCDGLELLQDIASASLLVTSATWAAELGQLLHRKTVLWLGAISESAAIWNRQQVVAFSDRTLACLGCSHRFGRDDRNVCLRGDIACLSSQLADGFIRRIESFANSDRTEVLSPAPVFPQVETVRAEAYPALHICPPSSAASVLVLTPVNPALPAAVIARARALAERAINGVRAARVVHDSAGLAPERGLPHPYRQEAMAKLRQEMIERHLGDEQWVFWVDADIVDYRADLVEQLIDRVAGGIAAPLVLMQGDVSEPPSNRFGFGPGRFYDVAGFVENGRWARFTEPYFDQLGPVYRLDSVGSCYLVNGDLYRSGARHEIDSQSKRFTEENLLWCEDTIAQNQRSPANCFSEHYSVCAFARRAGLPVQAFADLIAWHARP